MRSQALLEDPQQALLLRGEVVCNRMRTHATQCVRMRSAAHASECVQLDRVTRGGSFCSHFEGY